MNHLPSFIHDRLDKSKRRDDTTILNALKKSFEDLDAELLSIPGRIIPGFDQMSPEEIKRLPEEIRLNARDKTLLACNYYFFQYLLIYKKLVEGSCAVVAYTESGKLYMAHAGDSRAVLGSKTPDGSWKATRLTADHTPYNPVRISIQL
jgi:serine/threonine protein phosphatase PrpC